MANWSQLTVTDEGKKILASAIANKTNLNITHIKIGNNSDSALFGITDVSAVDNYVKIITTITNKDIKSNITLSELTLFCAHDAGEDIPFATATDNTPDTLPAYNGQTAVEQSLIFKIAVSDVENITATIDSTQLITVGVFSKHRTLTPIDHPDLSVTTPKLADLSVTTPKLADKSVTANKLADDVSNKIDLVMQKIYPVGSIYISTVATNPAELFGFGTWQAMPAGRVLIGAGRADSGTVYTAGTKAGEERHALTIDEMPSHNHDGSTSANGNHRHSRGDMDIVGWFTLPELYGEASMGSSNPGGAFWSTQDGQSMTQIDNLRDWTGWVYHFDASRAWTGASSIEGNHNHTINLQGNNEASNIMQPYLVAYIWTRIA